MISFLQHHQRHPRKRVPLTAFEEGEQITRGIVVINETPTLRGVMGPYRESVLEMAKVSMIRS